MKAIPERETVPPDTPAEEQEAGSTVLYTVRKDAQGNMLVELTDEGMLARLQQVAEAPPAEPVPTQQERTFFLAEQQPDGRYQVTLTEEGIRKFETALGLADDFGRHRKISMHSSIADLMERTATREELSEVTRDERTDRIHRLRRAILQVKYAGSEEPSGEQKTISHLLKAVMVLLVALWTLQQFGVALQDITDIPGILAGIPGDILSLDPGKAFAQVGQRIDDARTHLLLGLLGVALTYLAARIIEPFGRIYRKDQLVTGQRPAVRAATWALRLADRPPTTAPKRSLGKPVR